MTLSMHSLFPRFVEAERDARQRPARVPAPPAAASGGGAVPIARVGGMGELVDGDSAARLPAGARSGCATPAAAIIDGRDGWRVATRARGRSTRRAVILALPAYAAAPLLAHDRCASRGAVRRGALRLDRERRARLAARARSRTRCDGTGFVVARGDSDGRITACTWVSSKWAGRAPDGRGAAARVHRRRARSRRRSTWPTTSWSRVAVRDLAPVLGISGIAGAHAASIAGATPARSTMVGHLARLARSSGASRGCTADCSPPAAAFARSAFPTASPTAARPRRAAAVRQLADCGFTVRRGEPRSTVYARISTGSCSAAQPAFVRASASKEVSLTDRRTVRVAIRVAMATAVCRR